jgi:murein L,D-transpeptidase YcbB/YkuD
MAWRLAHSLEDLRKQINAAAPSRSKASDGTIGDPAHSARKSDHNPDGSGIVRALDITHDPRNGVHSQKLAEAVAAARPSRLKYIISNGRIMSGSKGPQPWVWRKYSGTNPHDKHAHFSVLGGAAGDKAGKWDLGGVLGAEDPGEPPVLDLPLLAEGSRGVNVERLQMLLHKHGYSVKIDGDFGPRTDGAVKAFQKAHKLVADGKVGSYTWRALLA